MNEKIKKIIAIVGAVVLVIVCAVWFLGSDLEHIEDTNGAENFALQTITDDNIIKRDVGAMGLEKSTDAISNTTTYSSEKFTGVEEIYSNNIWGNRLEITINHARVDSGNFKIVLLEGEKIVHEFALNELTHSYVLENPNGYISLRIAGESADFMLDYYII
ncbi:MAG: hypothetical protein IJ264_05140 [Clostridia bacterium]|nr:hypothetical protein [Clostridia bacterium]